MVIFFCVFSISIVGEEAVCPDGLFVPPVFRESDFYLNSLNYGLNLCTYRGISTMSVPQKLSMAAMAAIVLTLIVAGNNDGNSGGGGSSE